MDSNFIFSHIKKSDDQAHWIGQSNEEHSKGVAKLASEFASKFGFGSISYISGLLHDKGKEQKDFQTYIKNVSGMCPELKVTNHPPHAYVGALIAQKYYKSLLPFFAYPILGHHAGLADYMNYEDIMKIC